MADHRRILKQTDQQFRCTIAKNEHSHLYNGTGEIFCWFEFFLPEMPTTSHSDAESNVRLDDSLKYANGKLVVGECVRVA
jgi:hypothetical protein